MALTSNAHLQPHHSCNSSVDHTVSSSHGNWGVAPSQLHPKIPPSLLTLPYACDVAHSSFLVCGHPGTRYHFS
jgi:hypothetical protein